MQVGAGGVSGRALITDDGVLVDLDAVANRPAGEMPVERGEAAGVHHHHVAAVTAQPASPEAAHGEVVHDAAVGGVHRGSVIGGNVDPTMEVMTRTGWIERLEWIAGAAEALGDDAVHRPLPFAGRTGAEAFMDERGDLRLQRSPLRFGVGQHLLELRFDGGDLLLARGPLITYRLQLRLLVLDLLDDPRL